MLEHVAVTRRAVWTAHHNLTWHNPVRNYTSTHNDFANNNRKLKAAHQPVQAPSKSQKFVHVGRLFRATFQPDPLPFNCTTHASSPIFASDPTSVLGMMIRQRKENFDPLQFIWVARCPVDVIKKSTYRHKLCKRARHVFLQELGERGWDKDGKVVRKEDEMEEVAKSGRKNLHGALLILLGKGREPDKAKVLNAKRDEIKEDLEPVFQKLLQAQMRAETPLRADLDNHKRGHSGQARRGVTVRTVFRQGREGALLKYRPV